MANAINSLNFNDNIYTFTLPYGTCDTAAGTAAKTVDVDNFSLEKGARVLVKFTATNSASSPTLNVENTGAKAIYYRGSAINAGVLAANRTYEFVYNGTQWDLIGDLDTNTTYGAAGTSFGFVKSGGDVTISNGVITVNDDSHNHIIDNIDGLQTALNDKASATKWSCNTTVGAWSRICYVSGSYASYLISISQSQNSQATSSTFIVNIGYGSATISQIAGSGYIANNKPQIRLVKNTYTAVYVEWLNNFGYNGATTSSIECQAIKLSNVGEVFTYTSYTATASDAVVITTLQAQPTGIVSSKFYGALAGNADTATTATKLGTSTVGSTSLPIYLDAGTPKAISSAIPIIYGGTGATTAAGILTNLGITATATELNKLDGITATTTELNYVDGVTSNIQTQLNGKLGASATAAAAIKLTTSAGSKTQPVYFSGGKPVACTYALNKTVPADAVFTDTTYSAATTSASGLMTADMVTKLNGIATGANKYILPNATSSALGGVKIGSNITVSSGTISLTKKNVTAALGYTPPTTNTTYSIAKADAAGLVKPISVITKPTINSTTTTSGRYYSIQMSSDGNMFVNVPWGYSAATTSTTGLMSAEDKKRLNSIVGSTTLSIPNRTITELRTALDDWLDTYKNFAHATATFSGSANWIDKWNDEDLTTAFNAGGKWTVTVIASYSENTYVHLRFAYYNDQDIAYVVKNNNVWKPARKVAFKNKLSDGTVGSSSKPIYLNNGVPTECGALSLSTTGNAATATNVAWSGITSKPSYYDAKAIKSITRSGTTFTYTCMDGTTGTFTQQDNNTTYSAATQSAQGLMSAADKKKLDGIAAGANNYTYTLPTASSALGGVKTTSTVTSTSGLTACPIISGVVYYKDTNTTYSAAGNSLGLVKSGGDVTISSGVITVVDDSHNHTQLKGNTDNRAVATTPNDYNSVFKIAGLKTNSYIGSPSTDDYSGVIGFRQWSDNSGGKAHELAFNNSGLYMRQGASTSWEAWEKFITSGNYTSYTVKKDGTGASGTWGISVTGNAASATKATQDGSGNTITSTYLKLSGGTLSGKLTASGSITAASFHGSGSGLTSLNASNISSGTLAVARGGTGITSNPSMLINLGSTSAAKVFATSPRPGITGTLGLANGGTGKTTAKDAANAFINALDIGPSTPVDADYYICQSARGGTSTITSYRRPTSALWTYMKGKIDTTYYKTVTKSGAIGSVTLADKTDYIYTGVTSLTLVYPSGNFECWLSVTTSTSAITLSFPSGTKFIGASITSLAANTTYEISIKNKVAIIKKVG